MRWQGDWVYGSRLLDIEAGFNTGLHWKGLIPIRKKRRKIQKVGLEATMGRS